MKVRFGFKTLVIFAIVGFVAFLQSCQSPDGSHDMADEVGLVMDSIKTTFVPDRRVQIFDFTVAADGTSVAGRSSNRDAYDQVRRMTEKFPQLNLDSFGLITPMDTALINVSVGNMRSNPSHTAELATQVLMGMQVTVWDEDGYWYYIQSPDEYLAWIDGGALVFPDKKELAEYHQAEKVMYRDDFGFCYRSADKDSEVVSDLVAGDILRKTGQQGSYIQVMLPDGREGFVPAASVEPLQEIASSGIPGWPEVKKTAYKFMGRPYLWGGTSGKGVDCSGFTKMVYYLNGLELPRDASQQVNSGLEVPLDDDLSKLQPGDFLFFGKRGENGQKDKVTHVAIYIGEGKMIHSSQRVQVQSLRPGDPDYVPHRRNTLLSARRMIVDNSLAEGVQMIKNDEGYGF